jgi:hypothetical protein
MKKAMKWTQEENAILTKFWKGSRPSDEVAALLPGRSLYAIKHHAQKIGIATRKPGPVAYLKKSIVDLMKEHGPLCTLEMGSMLMCDRRQVDHHIRAMRSKKKVYVAGYVETRSGHLSKRWALGSQEDATYPQKGESVPVCAIAARPVKKQIIARDPITAALFGRRFAA